MKTSPLTLQKFELQADDMSGEIRNGIGLVAPFDFALDDEYYKWLPPDVPMFVTRTPELLDPNVTVDLAKQVSSELAVAPAVGSLLAVDPAAIGYACTSGSFVDGTKGQAQLQDVMLRAGARSAITTSGALAESLEYLDVKKIAIVTPYNEELTQLLVDYLAELGVEVVSAGYLDREQGIARISETAIRRIATEVNTDDADALFFSCTNLHTFDIIESLEAELNKPVLSANQVTVWSVLRAGCLTMPEHRQRLFRAKVV